MNAFHILQGTVIGREHVRVGRNNQDAAMVRRKGEVLAAVVADGCSSGRFSEIGARLGASFLAEHLAAAQATDETAVRAGFVALRDFLRFVALGMLQGDASSLASVVHDHFLFTILGAIMTPRRSIVFGVGDGVYSINGRPTILDSGPDNAPAYVGYDLLAPRLEHGKVDVHADIATPEIETLLLGTDGLIDLMHRAHEPLKSGEPQGGLAQFEIDPALIRNQLLLQKRLVVIGETNRRLRDDTTVVVLRRS